MDVWIFVGRATVIRLWCIGVGRLEGYGGLDDRCYRFEMKR
jgi:hypothetical protein